MFEQLNQFNVRQELPSLEAFAQQTEHALLDLADAVGSRRLPQPLPAFDMTLKQIHAHLEELYTLRLVELTDNQSNKPTRRAVLDYAFVSTLLDRIVNQVTVMHSQISKLNSTHFNHQLQQ